MKPTAYLRAAEQYVRDCDHRAPEFREWEIRWEADGEWQRVIVHRGIGRDGIEFGTAKVSEERILCLAVVRDGEGIIRLLREAIRDAIREAQHGAWLKSKNGLAFGIAGVWRKWEAA